MAKDLLLNNSKGYWDIDFENGDFKLTDGFETAILMSFFIDKRASANEVPRIELRRGWFGNKLSDYDNYEIGSKFWLLHQERKIQNTLNLINTYGNDSLSWFVTDNFATKIEVDSSFTENGIKLSVKLYKTQNVIFNESYKIWAHTNNIV